jgi:hypothetical protein
VFVGAVSDNFDERIEQKIFHSEIVVDNEKKASETAYKRYPLFYLSLMKTDKII